MSISTATISTTSGSSSQTCAPAENADRLQSKDSSLLGLEADIQSERITKILDGAIYKTKLAICLPFLVKERKTLSRVLTPRDFKELILFYNRISNPLVTSLIDMEAVEDIRSGDTKLRRRLCPNMAYFLCMLQRYEALKSNVEEFIEKIRNDYSNILDSKRNPVPPGLPYLVELERLRDLTSVRTSKSAAEVLQADITVRKLETENRKLVERIQEIATLLSDEMEHFEENMSKQNQEINKLQKQLAYRHRVANAKLRTTVRKSNNQMTLRTRAHNAQSSIVNEIEAETREVYDKLLNENVSQETTLRARRRKVDGQLSALIVKYDVDMTEKQKQLEEVNKSYDEEVKLLRNLKLKIAEQNKEFEPLMLEREEEYHAEMTEKMNRFRVEHAARVIQNAWRQVEANRKEKQRLLKLRKLQEAKAKAEMRAKAEEEALKKAAKKVDKKTKIPSTSAGSQERLD